MLYFSIVRITDDERAGCMCECTACWRCVVQDSVSPHEASIHAILSVVGELSSQGCLFFSRTWLLILYAGTLPFEVQMFNVQCLMLMKEKKISRCEKGLRNRREPSTTSHIQLNTCNMICTMTFGSETANLQVYMYACSCLQNISRRQFG